jgi:hypothetical protein
MRRTILHGVILAAGAASAVVAGCTTSSGGPQAMPGFDAATLDVTLGDAAADASPELEGSAPLDASSPIDSSIAPDVSLADQGTPVDSSTTADAVAEAAVEAGLDATAEAAPEASAPDAAPDVVEAGPSCVAAPSGLVAWWPGNGNADDVVGGDDGAFPGTYAAGEAGQAFSIDANDWVTCPDVPALDIGTMSVEVWFRHDQAGSLDPVVKKSDSSLTNGFALEFDSAGANLLFWVYTSAGWLHAPAAAIPLGAWTHAVGTYDGTNVTLYVDGMSVGSTADPGLIVPSSNPLMIGCDPSDLTTRTFVGLIEQVSFYDRGLTAAEVQALYGSGSLGKCAVSPDGG